jgi:Sulfotransferase domain
MSAPTRAGDRQAAGTSRAFAKSSLRAFGILTARLRGLPDFLIIGGKRAASTSLWNHVVRHPSVLPMFPSRQRIKGTSFFTTNWDRGQSWYRSHFALAAHRRVRSRRDGTPPITGEATPYYLFHPLAPERAAAVTPDARIVAILRDPVDRAYSHYRERARHGAEMLSFEEALAAEEERLEGEESRIIEERGYVSLAHEHLSYVAQGRYASMLERWYAAFPRDQVLVLLNEDFDRDPDEVLARLFAFLGLHRWEPPRLERYNFHPDPSMAPATRAELVERFREDNRRLESLLGVSLSGWGA